jgi:E3 ubiquitin-protein ligase SHPRH
MIYEGWSKVPVPLTKRQAVEAKMKGTRKNGSATKGRGKKKVVEDPEMDVDPAEEEGGHQDWPNYVNDFDVVIVTYPVLRSDFNVALAAPVRPRRADVKYSNVERPRSPLVMCEWYRVVMDEVQMVGGGKTEFVFISKSSWERF